MTSQSRRLVEILKGTLIRAIPRYLPSSRDPLLLISLGLIIFASIGALLRSVPLGDDTLVHIANVSYLAKDFPNIFWNPSSFNGYSSTIGFPWAVYAPLGLLVYLGLDPEQVFQGAFIFYFLLFGLSAYYFATKVGSPRRVAICISILVWAAVGYWEYSVRGGAYTRVFSLPFMFTALALTYDYSAKLNQSENIGRRYWVLLASWCLTLLGDIYIAIVGILLASIFLLLSSGQKNPWTCILRWAKLFLPVLAITVWYTIPLAEHVAGFGSIKSDTSPSLLSQIYWAGPVLTALAARKFQKSSSAKVSTELVAIIASLNIVSVYFLVMGWTNPLWQFLPRLMAAYDSLSVLSLIFPLLVASLFAMVKLKMPIRFTRQLGAFLIILVIANATITIPTAKPLDWGPTTNAFGQGIANNLNFSSDFRVSLLGRSLTRFFPFYYPDASETGGRVYVLDQNAFYQSWYQTEVFYKDDIGALGSVYIEDRPYRDATQLLGPPNDFAEVTFWLDWFGVDSLAMSPTLYPINNTEAGYMGREALFATSESSLYPQLFFVKYTAATPVVVATNSPVIGFFSRQQYAGEEYNSLLALLTYLGLGSRHVIPVYLQSLPETTPGMLDYLITDSQTYFEQPTSFSSLLAQGVKVLVAPSPSDPAAYSSSLQPTASDVTSLTVSLPQLQKQGTSGSYELLESMPSILRLQRINSTSVTPYPSQMTLLPPGDFALGSTRNAKGLLAVTGSNLTVTVNVDNATDPAELNLTYRFAKSLPLLGTMIQSEKADAGILVSARFLSDNHMSNYLAYTREVEPGNWASFQDSISNYTSFSDPANRFLMANSLNLTLNIPPGHPSVTFQLADLSISTPSFNVYELPAPLSLAIDGFFVGVPSPSGNSSLVLSNFLGDLAGNYDLREGSQFSTIIPLAEFASESGHSFTEVITSGLASNDSISLETIQQGAWAPLTSDWRNPQNLDIQNSPPGFRGILWKETYTPAWSIQAVEGEAGNIPLAYYFSGPGLVYIPTGSQSVSLRVSYVPLTIPEMSVIILGVGSLIPLVIFRKRIYKIGSTKFDKSNLLDGETKTAQAEVVSFLP